MKSRLVLFLLTVTLLSGAASPALAQSVITTRPDDPAAVYLTREDFGVTADGVADDSVGNVYVTNGQVFLYNIGRSGRSIWPMSAPERR